MQTALLIVHLIVAASLVAVVLFQQSEGGALGMGGGGGGGGGGFMSGRGSANLLTRVTGTLALAFFCTSITLTILANRGTAPRSILDSTSAPTSSAPSLPGLPSDGAATTSETPPAPASGGGGVLDNLKKNNRQLPRIPQGQ